MSDGSLRPSGVSLPPASLACLLLVTAAVVRAWWCGPSGRDVTQQQLSTGALATGRKGSPCNAWKCSARIHTDLPEESCS